MAQLTGTAIADRVQSAARASNGSAIDKMHQRLLHYIELDAHQDDQAILRPGDGEHRITLEQQGDSNSSMR